MSISNTQSAAVVGIGIVAAAVILSDNSDSGVVRTVQRVLPGSTGGSNDDRVSYEQFTDSTSGVVDTGTDAVDTAVITMPPGLETTQSAIEKYEQ